MPTDSFCFLPGDDHITHTSSTPPGSAPFKPPVAVVVPGARHLHELVEQRLPAPGQHLGDAVLSAPGAPRQETAGGRDESGGNEARRPQPPAARLQRARVPPCAGRGEGRREVGEGSARPGLRPPPARCRSSGAAAAPRYGRHRAAAGVRGRVSLRGAAGGAEGAARLQVTAGRGWRARPSARPSPRPPAAARS